MTWPNYSVLAADTLLHGGLRSQPLQQFEDPMAIHS